MRSAWMGLALAATLIGSRPLAAQDKGYVVIVNSFNPFTSIAADDLSKIYLKKLATWSNGQTAMPVDQAATSPVRKRFAASVLNKDLGALTSYWQQMIFSGKAVPPPALDTDAAVVEFVRHNPYAVGYVSSTATLGSDVRVIAVTR